MIPEIVFFAAVIGLVMAFRMLLQTDDAVERIEFQAFDTGDGAVTECTWQKTIGMYFGCYTGSAICEWYDYTEPFSWD